MKKNYLLYFLLLALSTPIWVSCNDWTESKQKITSKVLQKNTMQPCAHIKSLIIPKLSDGSATGQAKALH